jgi:hypothetical protein
MKQRRSKAYDGPHDGRLLDPEPIAAHTTLAPAATQPRWLALTAALLIFLAAPWAATAAGYSDQDTYAEDAYQDDASAAAYSFLRLVEGNATLVQDDRDEETAEANQPLLTGDRLLLGRRARIEAVLSDGSIVRIEEESNLLFEALGASPDQSADGTVLRLENGEIQLNVPAELYADLYPRVDIPAGAVYIQQPGSFLIDARSDGFVELVVRDGLAELVTERGSMLVRAGEEALVDGGGLARIDLLQARSRTSLERWGDDLERDARRSDSELGGRLAYAGSSLEGHGSWITVSGQRAWRPRVSSSWRPYYSGRWAYTPSGLTWVSYEPWGWVPYHYGSWDYAPSFGWVWYPGYRYAPAWVYWYYGPSYVGWCPTGYYTNYYRNYYHNGYTPTLAWGTYGWGRGHSRDYDRWNFVDYDNFGRGVQARHTRPGRDLTSSLQDGQMPRGIITTDTRGLKPALIRRPGEAIEVLQTRPAVRGKPGGELPDVTSFVARERLSPEAEARVISRRTPRVDGAAVARGEVVAIERPTLRGEKPATVRSSGGVPAQPRSGRVDSGRVDSGRVDGGRVDGTPVDRGSAGEVRSPGVRVTPRDDSRKPAATPRSGQVNGGEVGSGTSSPRPSAGRKPAEARPPAARDSSPPPAARPNTATSGTATPREARPSAKPAPSAPPPARTEPARTEPARPQVRPRPEAKPAPQDKPPAQAAPPAQPQVRQRSQTKPAPQAKPKEDDPPPASRSAAGRSTSAQRPYTQQRPTSQPQATSERPGVRSASPSPQRPYRAVPSQPTPSRAAPSRAVPSRTTQSRTTQPPTTQIERRPSSARPVRQPAATAPPAGSRSGAVRPSSPRVSSPPASRSATGSASSSTRRAQPSARAGSSSNSGRGAARSSGSARSGSGSKARSTSSSRSGSGGKASSSSSSSRSGGSSKASSGSRGSGGGGKARSSRASGSRGGDGGGSGN